MAPKDEQQSGSAFESGLPVLRFGTRPDFERAILEIKWLSELRGEKRSQSTVQDVARKYGFPPEFLKAGIDGGLESQPDLVKSSPWWPVIYSWTEQQGEAERAIRKTAAYRAKANYDMVWFTGIGVATVIGLLEFATIPFAISAASVTVGLFIALYRRAEDWSEKLEEAIYSTRKAGYPELATQFMDLAKRNPLFAYYSYKHDLEVKPTRIVSEFGGMTTAPDGSPAPVFWVLENPDQEYAKRVRELRAKRPKKESEDTEKEK
jgi:hypothetical protein